MSNGKTARTFSPWRRRSCATCWWIARARFAKRGGHAQQVELSAESAISVEPSAELLALDEALHKLARLDERKSRIVELRYFGGLSVDETAGVLGISGITVKREWLKAKAWLYRELNYTPRPEPA